MRLSLLLTITFLYFGTIFATSAENNKSSDTLKPYLEALAKNPEDYVALKAMGQHFLSRGNFEEAQKYGDRLLALATETDDKSYPELYGNYITGVCDIYTNPERAFSRLASALLTAHRMNDREALISINNSLGNFYLLVRNDVYQATEYYHEAIKEAKIAKNKKRQAIVTSNLAGALMLSKDPGGIELALEADSLAEEIEDPEARFYSKFALSYHYAMADSIEKAKEVLAILEDIVETEGFARGSEMYLLAASISEKSGEPKVAETLYTSALEQIADSTSSDFIQGTCHYGLFLIKYGKPGKAEVLLKKCLDANNGKKASIYIPELLKTLGEAYKSQGKTGEALTIMEKYEALRDSNFIMTRERMVQDAKVRNGLYEKEQTIASQNEKLKVSYLRIRWLLCVITCLGIIVLISVGANRRKNRLYKAIVSQNNEWIRKGKSLMQPAAGKIRNVAEAFEDLVKSEKIHRDPDLNLTSLAERLGTNRTYLSKAINDTFGKTFTQYVNDLRIADAVSMISDTKADIPIKQIASDVGFTSLSRFYRTFRDVTGLPPAEYRKQVVKLSRSV